MSTADVIRDLETAMTATREARGCMSSCPAGCSVTHYHVGLPVEPARELEPWEVDELMAPRRVVLVKRADHDACPARTVGDGATVCMAHHVAIPR